MIGGLFEVCSGCPVSSHCERRGKCLTNPRWRKPRNELELLVYANELRVELHRLGQKVREAGQQVERIRKALQVLECVEKEEGK